MLSGRGSIGVGGGAVWLVTAENVESTLTRINPANGNVEAKIPLPSRGSGVVFDYRSVWVTAPNSGELYRIDPSTNQITSTTRLHGLPGSIATGEGSIWVVNDRDRIIDRIDPMTDQLVSSIATGLVDPVYGSGIAVGGGYVWVAFYPAAIIQIDPKTNAVLRRFMGGLGRGVDYGAESLWKAGPSIQRISATQRVTRRVSLWARSSESRQLTNRASRLLAGHTVRRLTWPGVRHLQNCRWG